VSPAALGERVAHAPGVVLRHLRLFESVQILIPGLYGMLAEGALPAATRMVVYLLAYASHVLSVYSYNDYCDQDADSRNPRKRAEATKSRRWLGNQTLLLVAVFVVSASFLPVPVGALLLANQVLCMAYSAPAIRLKARPLGSEVAHFFAGFSYFVTGVVMAGGTVGAHWMGALLFGVLYLSGGTFNEIMDRDADAAAGLRHLVVRAGRRFGLALVVALHAVAFVLVALLEPSLPVLVATVAGALGYGHALRRATGEAATPQALLGFRRRYRLVFAGLLLVLGATMLGGAGLDGWDVW